MKYLVLLRGIPGSGKSSFIDEKYKPYVISPDQLRILTTGIKYDKTGKPYIPQDKNHLVWELTYSLIKERMKEGSFIIVDATHTTKESINTYKKYVNKYGYKTIVIDFSNLSLEEAKRNNQMRSSVKQVPETIIDNMYEKIKNNNIPKFIDYIFKIEKDSDFRHSNFEDYIKILKQQELLYPKKINKNIVFIGDIHGMYQEFEKLLTNIDNINNKFLVFIGDYFDRFPNEEELVKLFDKLYELQQKDNTYFIRGNHELYEFYLENYIKLNEEIKKLSNNLVSLKKAYQENIKKKENLNIKINVDNIGENFRKLAQEKEELFKNRELIYEEYYKYKMKELRTKEKLLKFFAGYEAKKQKMEEELNKVKISLNKIRDKLGRQKMETIETLEKHGRLKKLLEFEKKLNTIFLYENNEKYIFANHGGIPLKPSILINEKEYIKGIGEYGEEEEIAKNFEKNAPEYFQVFGHRDIYFKGPQLSKNVYNLNGSAELGYDLRAMEYDINENKPVNVFQIFTERQTRHTVNKSYKHGNILQIAQDHPYIKVKDLGNNIYSLNFTSEAFLKKKKNR